MLSKCANPSCSTSFLYFHCGKLFRVERRAPVSVRDEAEMTAQEDSRAALSITGCAKCVRPN